MNEIALRLSQHLRTEAAEIGELAAVLDQIAVAGKLIARELGRASLIGQLGLTGDVNVQGEAVKKLDVWANDVMVRVLDASGVVCTMVSEEMDEPLHLAERCPAGQFVVCFDPVDGSSNLDVNGIVGTIFSVRRRRGRGIDHAAADAVQPGSAQVAAGYVMYGPSTVLVYTAGYGVHAFTLDPTIGEFLLSKVDLQIPPRGTYYSINESYSTTWSDAGYRNVVDAFKGISGKGQERTARYIGSLVADFHRNMLKGG